MRIAALLPFDQNLTSKSVENMDFGVDVDPFV